jgi:hypothetical protein
MFEKIRCVEITSLEEVHKIANECGNFFAAVYGCHYEYGELYVSASKKSKFAAI